MSILDWVMHGTFRPFCKRVDIDRVLTIFEVVGLSTCGNLTKIKIPSDTNVKFYSHVTNKLPLSYKLTNNIDTSFGKGD